MLVEVYIHYLNIIIFLWDCFSYLSNSFDIDIFPLNTAAAFMYVLLSK